MWNLANSSSLVSGSWTPDRGMRCNCPHEKRSKNKQARQEAARSKRSKQKKECNEIPSFAACTLTKNTNSPVGRRQGEWTCMVFTMADFLCCRRMLRTMDDAWRPNPVHMMCSFIISSPHGDGDDGCPHPPPCRCRAAAVFVSCQRGLLWQLA